jgi:hypothetical protein
VAEPADKVAADYAGGVGRYLENLKIGPRPPDALPADFISDDGHIVVVPGDSLRISSAFVKQVFEALRAGEDHVVIDSMQKVEAEVQFVLRRRERPIGE